MNGYHGIAMLHLRLKNPVSARRSHHRSLPSPSPDFPGKPRVHKLTERQSRKAAENGAAKNILDTADPYYYRSHPLAKTKAVTVDMEFDEEAGVFVTQVKELHRMSTYGKSELDALKATAEMIRGYLSSMEASGKKIPLAPAKLSALKRAVRS